MNKLTKLLSSILIIALLSTCFSTIGYANTTTNSLSSTVQSYKAAKGWFTLTKKSRFFIVSNTVPGKEIQSTVKLISSEFAATKKPSKTSLPIVYGNESDARNGDIVIKLTTGYKAESYRLSVNSITTVAASDSDGIFYGLRTLLQYFIAQKSNKINCFAIKDSPDVKERILHLDCGRKYYSKTWIKNLIKQMSWMKYNSIEIHFSEDQALRLESKTFPWLAGSTNGSKKYLTQKDMAQICKTAAKYHIEVIPSFDSPGHMNYIVRKYASYIKSNPKYSFKYNGRTYSKKSVGFSNISNYYMYKNSKSSYNYRGIDLANTSAVGFTSALIDEYADFFAKHGCTKFNIGGDELLGWSKVTVGGKTFDFNTKWNALQHWDSYAQNILKIKNGNASDTFIRYLNKTATRLENKGYSIRVWSGEINRNSNQHLSLNSSIKIVYWSNDSTSISSLKKKGYSFYNANSLWTYYVLRKNSAGKDIMKTTYKNVNGKKIFKNWNPKSFSDPGYSAKKVSSSQYKGAYFCIWSDMASYKSSTTVWKEIQSRMWANSAKMWNTQVCTLKSGNKKALSYSKFKKATKKLGCFPGYKKSCHKTVRLPAPKNIKKIS